MIARYRALCAAMAATLMLQGCAAAVIPLAAGAAMGNSLRKDAGKRNEAASPARPGSEAELSERVELLDLAELPPPSGGSGQSMDRAIDAFAAYSLEQAALAKAGGDADRPSALLANPGSLKPERAACGNRPLAVLIDLDPGRNAVDPLQELDLPRQLAPALEQLRAQDIRVAWISRLGSAFRESLQIELHRAGMDRAYGDLILLPDTIDQRKQTMRAELGKTHCIVAILGEERYDFDELYLYLKNEDAGFALDLILGQGWFLTSDPGASDAPPAHNTTTEQSPGDQ